ncbi:hypothetical protein EVAR_98221_1 [Eumeta japonica]|uniref:Uncharacterized protein n=1 Tax=Eumeta variegata TaxID=151549 RepID=A0A4C1Y379_EUMVA|nr:hypothetical protein EVAR_98221_1 [Eumeta japonica]
MTQSYRKVLRFAALRRWHRLVARSLPLLKIVRHRNRSGLASQSKMKLNREPGENGSVVEDETGIGMDREMGIQIKKYVGISRDND